MSDVSVVLNDVIGYIHGKVPASQLSSDAKKLLLSVEKVVSGIVAAAPDVPNLLSDVLALTAEGSALAASKGFDLPELQAAGNTLVKLSADFADAQARFTAGIANYKTAAHVVATASPIQQTT